MSNTGLTRKALKNKHFLWLGFHYYCPDRLGHKIDVQCVYNISFPVLPNLPESVRLNIGMPVVRTDGCSFVRCTVT